MSGVFVLDAYAGFTNEQLKSRCIALVSAVDKYQHISMILADHAPDALNNLPDAWRTDVLRLIDAYKDDYSPANPKDTGA